MSTPVPVTSLVVTGFPSPVVAGTQQIFTVTARDANGNTAAGYRGTVHVTSTDAQATLPSDRTFTAADGGIATLAANLKTPGTWSIAAADAGAPSVAGARTGVQVTAAAAAVLTISPASASIVAGGTATFVASARDAYGNAVTDPLLWSTGSANAICPAGVCASTTVGTYTVTASAGGATGTATLIVTKAAASVALSGGPFTYTGAAQNPTLATSPAGLRVTTRYTGTTSGGAAFSIARASGGHIEYTGPEIVAAPSSTSTATVISSASVTVPVGNVATARVTFSTDGGATAIAGCANVAVTQTIGLSGSATCQWTAVIPDSAGTVYAVTAVLGGKYAPVSVTEDVRVVVSRSEGQGGD